MWNYLWNILLKWQTDLITLLLHTNSKLGVQAEIYTNSMIKHILSKEPQLWHFETLFLLLYRQTYPTDFFLPDISQFIYLTKIICKTITTAAAVAMTMYLTS
jgi:hypothetical protein